MRSGADRSRKTGTVGDGGPDPSEESENGLDWLNFFIADVQTGFGPFVALYLAAEGWSEGGIGLILTVGTVAGIGSQIPGGALVDGVERKRLLVAVALGMVAVGAVLFFASADFWVILAAQILHGGTAGIIAPGVTAIGLGLVGARGLSRRLGRNHRYDSFGNAGTAAVMGLLGQFVFKRAAFLFAAVLCLPAIWALWRIDGDEIDYARARNASRRDRPREVGRLRDLLRNRNLLVLGAVLILFQVANASTMPLVSDRLGRAHSRDSELVIALLVIVPQALTAAIAGRTARLADRRGRRPLLLVAFAALIARILLFSIAPSRWWLVPMQALGGIDAAVIGILTPLVTADVTRGSGRFNLAQGAIGMAIGLGAAFSTTASGFVAERFGIEAGFWALAAVAGGGLLVVLLFLPETRPTEERAA